MQKGFAGLGKRYSQVDDSTHIIVSIVGFFGVVVTALLSYLTHRHTREINDAVNHRHEKRGADAPKLYDMMWENHQKADELIQWKRSYDGGPLDHGCKVVEFVEETEHRLDAAESRIESLENADMDDL